MKIKKQFICLMGCFVLFFSCDFSSAKNRSELLSNMEAINISDSDLLKLDFELTEENNLSIKTPDSREIKLSLKQRMDSDVFKEYLYKESRMSLYSGANGYLWTDDRSFLTSFEIEAENLSRRFAFLDEANQAAFKDKSGTIQLELSLTEAVLSQGDSLRDITFGLYVLDGDNLVKLAESNLKNGQHDASIHFRSGRSIDQGLLNLTFVGINPYALLKHLREAHRLFVRLENYTVIEDDKIIPSRKLISEIEESSSHIILQIEDQREEFFYTPNGSETFLDFVARYMGEIKLSKDSKEIISISNYVSDFDGKLIPKFIEAYKRNQSYFVYLTNSGDDYLSPLKKGQSYALVYSKIGNYVDAFKKRIASHDLSTIENQDGTIIDKIPVLPNDKVELIIKRDRILPQVEDVEKTYKTWNMVKKCVSYDKPEGRGPMGGMHRLHNSSDVSNSRCNKYANVPDTIVQCSAFFKEVNFINAQFRFDQEDLDLLKFYVSGKEIMPEVEYYDMKTYAVLSFQIPSNVSSEGYDFLQIETLSLPNIQLEYGELVSHNCERTQNDIPKEIEIKEVELEIKDTYQIEATIYGAER